MDYNPVATDQYQKVELFFACRKLKDLDILSKSDPQVKVSVNSGKGFVNVGSTEVQRNNLNPNFTQSIYVDFIFEVKQIIKFEVLDVDKHSTDVIGEVETTVGAIVGAKNQTSILDLHHKSSKSTGKIIIKADQVHESRENLYMQWSGIKIANVDGFFGKSDPFLRFLRKNNSGGDFLMNHETEKVMDSPNPIWKPFSISSQKLCNGDDNLPISVECWDWEKSLKFKFIGSFTTCLGELKAGKRDFMLENPKIKHPGTIRLNSFSAVETPTFLDYIRGGEQLNFIAAVDFTGSNGIPTDPRSLHALPINGFNQYQQALLSIGEIILNFDYDKMIPMFGFGGKPNFPNFKSHETLHCFPLTGDPQVAEVAGIQGIMDAYINALQHVQLSGPTLFEPIIDGVQKVAYSSQGNDVYTVLLIITDGEIHDMQKTIDKIVECQALPLSIIIVGVGNDDFVSMQKLDCDQGRLTDSKGRKCGRDLVQFVAIRNFINDPAAFSREVLAELPKQLVEYKMMVGKKPRQPQAHMNISQM